MLTNKFFIGGLAVVLGITGFLYWQLISAKQEVAEKDMAVAELIQQIEQHNRSMRKMAELFSENDKIITSLRKSHDAEISKLDQQKRQIKSLKEHKENVQEYLHSIIPPSLFECLRSKTCDGNGKGGDNSADEPNAGLQKRSAEG